MKWTDLSLSALQYFVDTIDFGSLTLAAEKNHVSRPAISQSIRRIEDVIGFEVISHSKNKLELTEKGRAFYQKAKASLTLFSSALSEVSQNSGQMRLACSASLAEHLVVPVLQELKSFNPVQIQIGTTSKVRQLIVDGEANLGLIIDDEKTFGLESTFLKSGKFVLRSKTGRFIEPLITTEARPEVASLLKVLKKTKKSVSSHMQIESWSVCKKTAEIIGGSCLVPDLFARDFQKDIREIKFTHTYKVLAIYRDKNLLSEAELEMIRLLQS